MYSLHHNKHCLTVIHNSCESLDCSCKSHFGHGYLNAFCEANFALMHVPLLETIQGHSTQTLVLMELAKSPQKAIEISHKASEAK